MHWKKLNTEGLGSAETDLLKKSEIVRELGKFEKFLSQDAERNGWFTAINRFLIRSKREINQEHMKTATEMLQRRYSCLRLTIVEESGVRYFAEIPDAPDFKTLPTSDAMSLMENEAKFKQGQLLWRVRLLPEETHAKSGFLYSLVVATHSCIDGISLGHIIETLFDYLEDSTALDATAVRLHDVRSVPHLPPREHAYPEADASVITSMTTECDNRPDREEGRGMRSLALKVAEMYKPKNPQPIIGGKKCSFNMNKTVELINAAKRNEVTLNSACISAIAIATFTFLAQKRVLTSDSLRFRPMFALSLRRFVDMPSSDATGSYYADCYHDIHIKKDQVEASNSAAFWDIARSIESEVKGIVASRQPLVEAMNWDAWYDSVGNDFAQFTGPEPDLFIDGLVSITNLGKISFGKNNTIVKLEKIFPSGAAPDLFLFNIYTVNGELNIDLGYNTIFVPDEFAETFLSTTKEQLSRVF
jgi:hypothetical protein